jgi:hypothetical protein
MKRSKTTFNQVCADSLAAMLRGDSKVMQITSPSFVPAQHCANQFPVTSRDKTHAGIAPEEFCQVFP